MRQSRTQHGASGQDFKTGARASATDTVPGSGRSRREPCGEPNRLLIRTASNAYFPQKLTVISLPDRDETVKQADRCGVGVSRSSRDIEELRYERKKAKVKAALEGISDEEAFAEIAVPSQGRHQGRQEGQSRRTGDADRVKGRARRRPTERQLLRTALCLARWDSPWMRDIARVILVHRLREVVAQVGFTRFEAAAPTSRANSKWASAAPPWPARFLGSPPSRTRARAFSSSSRPKRSTNGSTRPDVQERGRQLDAGFTCWRDEHQGTQRSFRAFRT